MRNLLTTEQWLKDNGLIQDNVDAKLIVPTILLVQEKYIHHLLGTDLYTEIQTQINDSTEGTNDEVSELNQTLLNDYVLWAMLWYIHHEATPILKYRYMNKGVMVKNSENSSAADLTEIKFMMDRWKNDAEMFAQRTTNYLKAHCEDYPLFDANTACDAIKPNKNNYSSSLWLDED